MLSKILRICLLLAIVLPTFTFAGDAQKPEDAKTPEVKKALLIIQNASQNTHKGENLDEVLIIEKKKEPLKQEIYGKTGTNPAAQIIPEHHESKFLHFGHKAKDAAMSVAKKVAELEINVDTDINKIDFGSFGDFGIHYGIGVNIRSNNKFYRIDKLTLRFDINPGDYIGQEMTPINLGITSSKEMAYIRAFSSLKESLLVKPLTFGDLPINDKKALALKNGDFFSIPSKMAFSMGAHFFGTVGPLVGGAGLDFVVSGQFIFHIFRLEDQKVRVKVLSIREKRGSIGGSVFIPVQITGFSLVDSLTDNFIDKFVELNILKMGISKAKDYALVLDYIFDLSKDNAKHAYNSFLGNVYELNLKKIVSTKMKDEKVKYIPISHVNDVEEVVQKQINEPFEKRSLVRIFKSVIEADVISQDYRASIIIANIKHQRVHVKNQFTFEDHFRKKRHYYMPVFNQSQDDQYGGRFFENKTENNFFVLYDSDPAFKKVFFRNYGINYFKKLLLPSLLQLEDLQGHLYMNFPKSINDKIRLYKVLLDDHNSKTSEEKVIEDVRKAHELLYMLYQSIPLESRDKKFSEEEKKIIAHIKSLYKKNHTFFQRAIKKLQIVYHILLRKEALDYLLGLEENYIRAEFKKFIQNIPPYSNRIANYKKLLRTIFRFHENAFVSGLYNFLNTVSKKDKSILIEDSGQLIKLAKLNSLFQNVGLGFLFHLLKNQKIEDMFYINFILSVNGDNVTTFDIGNKIDENLYHYIGYNNFAKDAVSYSVGDLESDQEYLLKMKNDLRANVL